MAIVQKHEDQIGASPNHDHVASLVILNDFIEYAESEIFSNLHHGIYLQNHLKLVVLAICFDRQ